MCYNQCKFTVSFAPYHSFSVPSISQHHQGLTKVAQQTLMINCHLHTTSDIRLFKRIIFDAMMHFKLTTGDQPEPLWWTVSPSTPIIRGAEGPQMSISITETLNLNILNKTQHNTYSFENQYIFSRILSKYSGNHRCYCALTNSTFSRKN